MYVDNTRSSITIGVLFVILILRVSNMCDARDFIFIEIITLLDHFIE